MRLILSSLLLLTSFIASSQKPYKTQIENLPIEGRETTIETGMPIVLKVAHNIHKGFTLKSIVRKKGMSNIWIIPSGELYLYDVFPEWELYKIKEGKVIQQGKGSANDTWKYDGGIMIHRFRNKRRIFTSEGDLILRRKKVKIPAINFHDVILPGKVKFKQEFIYSGRSGNTLKFMYREFIDDMARAAFYQEAQYDLNEGNIIGFRSLKIEVIKASNSSIEYKVISHFQ